MNNIHISSQLALATGNANGLGREIACRLTQKKSVVSWWFVIWITMKAIKTADYVAATHKSSNESFETQTIERSEEELRISGSFKLKPKIVLLQLLCHRAFLINYLKIMPFLIYLSPTVSQEGRPRDSWKIINVKSASHFLLSYRNCVTFFSD